MRADERKQVAEIYWRSWHDSHAPFIPQPVVDHRGLGFFLRRVERFGSSPVVAVEDDKVIGFVVWCGDRLDQPFDPQQFQR